MNYAVAWKPSAEQELAQIWLNAPDRPAVTEAANRLDALLQADPYATSESRGGPTRILIEDPLAVLFEVDDDSHFVDVLKIWRTRGPR